MYLRKRDKTNYVQVLKLFKKQGSTTEFTDFGFLSSDGNRVLKQMGERL